MIHLYYTTYISVDLAQHELLVAKVGKGVLLSPWTDRRCSSCTWRRCFYSYLITDVFTSSISLCFINKIFESCTSKWVQTCKNRKWISISGRYWNYESNMFSALWHRLFFSWRAMYTITKFLRKTKLDNCNQPSLVIFSSIQTFEPRHGTIQWRSQNAEKVTHIKGRLLVKQWFSSIAYIFIMGTSLKGKNLLQEGANSFF